jgi:hypothetical protein
MSFEKSSDSKKEEVPFAFDTQKEFPGAFIVRMGDTNYAIEENINGNYEGVSFTINDEGGLISTEQLDKEDLDNLKEQGVLGTYENATTTSEDGVAEIINHEKIMGSYLALLSIFEKGNRFDPKLGNVSEITRETEVVKVEVESLDLDVQEELAQKFFDATVGTDPRTKANADVVLRILEGTRFAAKFKDLESSKVAE